MARTKERSTIDKVAAARNWLDMTKDFPELLARPDAAERLAEVREAFGLMIEFRNLVRFVAEMDEPPRVAAGRYLDL